jgi:hypothetical protein
MIEETVVKICTPITQTSWKRRKRYLKNVKVPILLKEIGASMKKNCKLQSAIRWVQMAAAIETKTSDAIISPQSIRYENKFQK